MDPGGNHVIAATPRLGKSMIAPIFTSMAHKCSPRHHYALVSEKLTWCPWVFGADNVGMVTRRCLVECRRAHHLLHGWNRRISRCARGPTLT